MTSLIPRHHRWNTASRECENVSHLQWSFFPTALSLTLPWFLSMGLIARILQTSLLILRSLKNPKFSDGYESLPIAYYSFLVYWEIWWLFWAFRQPKMKTVPNLFITNLAIADGIVSLVNVPLVAVHAHLSYWPFGKFLCKVLPFLQGVSLSASIGTMMAIAADRYKVIVHYELPKLTLTRAKFWIVAIWLASCVLPSPLLYYSTTIQAPVHDVIRTKCTEIWPNPTAVRVFSLMVFLFLYFIPLAIICGLYGLIARAFKNLPTAQKGKTLIRLVNQCTGKRSLIILHYWTIVI